MYNTVVVGSTFETVESSQLSTAVAGLSLQSNGDGNVPTIEAILHAARASEPDSSIFVFTDSSPSDENLLGQAEAIVAQKNLRVVFIHDASSLNKRSTKQLKMNKLRHKRQTDISLVYKELEIFSGGETITVPRTEISDLAVFVSFSAIQSNNVIFCRAATLSGNTEHYFLVDSYTFQIIIFINGQSIAVSSVTTPQGKLASVLLALFLLYNLLQVQMRQLCHNIQNIDQTHCILLLLTQRILHYLVDGQLH